MSAPYCPACQGHGVVRARDGRPYRTVDGARVAEEHGTSRPCDPCDGSGLPMWRLAGVTR